MNLKMRDILWRCPCTVSTTRSSSFIWICQWLPISLRNRNDWITSISWQQQQQQQRQQNHLPTQTQYNSIYLNMLNQTTYRQNFVSSFYLSIFSATFTLHPSHFVHTIFFGVILSWKDLHCGAIQNRSMTLPFVHTIFFGVLSTLYFR